MILKPKRGDIWLARLDPAEGSEQAGIRPVLIIQVDVLNEVSPVTIALPFTSQVKKLYHGNVFFSQSDTGLPRDSVLLANQMRTLSKTRLLKKMGSINSEKMHDVERAFLAVVGVRKS